MPAPHRKYLKGLSKQDAERHEQHMKRRKQQYRRGRFVNTVPTLGSYRHEKSRHVKDFRRLYGISTRDKESIAKSTGVSPAKQARILARGRAAWATSGSRPGQSPSSWAYARLASALLGRKACAVDRHILSPVSCDSLRRQSRLDRASASLAERAVKKGRANHHGKP